MDNAIADKEILVAFDLDDTLYKEVDFVDSAYRFIGDTLKKDFNIDNAYSILAEANKRGENAFDALLAKVDDKRIDIPYLLQLYRNHTPNLRLDAFTLNTLESLKGQGFHLALITDGRAITQRNKITALGLYDFIDTLDIIISEEMGTEKTDKQNFKYFNDKYPSYKRFYYIGDNTAKDFYWANRLGWTTICITDDGRNIHKQNFEGDNTHLPCYIVDNFYEILEFIE